MVSTVVNSIELEGSDAPLLLSSKAQAVLGLIIDMSEYTCYSKTWDCELELTSVNGIPALKLYPNLGGAQGIALMLQQDPPFSGSDDDETVGSACPVDSGTLWKPDGRWTCQSDRCYQKPDGPELSQGQLSTAEPAGG